MIIIVFTVRIIRASTVYSIQEQIYYMYILIYIMYVYKPAITNYVIVTGFEKRDLIVEIMNLIYVCI